MLPIDDRRFERLNATIAGRPQLITGTSQVLFPGMKRLSEGSVIDIKNRSFSVTASIDAPADGPANGVIIAQGGKFGGWAFYLKQGRAKFVYNVLGMQEFIIGATEDLTPGKHQVRAEFAYDGGGLAKGGTVTLFYDGASVGTGRVNVTQPLIFSADETTDIGNDYGMPVSTDYAAASRFNGRIDVVQIDVGDDDQSHLIDPENRSQRSPSHDNDRPENAAAAPPWIRNRTVGQELPAPYRHPEPADSVASMAAEPIH